MAGHRAFGRPWLPVLAGLLVVLWGAWMLLGRGEEGASPVSVGSAALPQGVSGRPGETGGHPSRSPIRVHPGPSISGDAHRAATPGAALRVHVTRADSGDPVAVPIAKLLLGDLGEWSAYRQPAGYIRFAGLPEGSGIVCVTAPGFLDGSTPVALVEGAEVDVVVALHPHPAITGRVLSDATGLPVSGAEVRVSISSFQWPRPLGGPADARTDGEGRFSVSVGSPGDSVRLQATAIGFATGETELVLPAAGVQPAHPDIRLRRAGILRGVVKDPSGRPVPGATIRVSPAGSMLPPGPPMGHRKRIVFTPREVSGALTFSAADGTFACEKLDAGGLYMLEASVDDAWGSLDCILVPEDRTGEAVEVHLLPGGTLVVKTVFGEGVHPCKPSAMVMGETGPGRGSQWFWGTSDPEWDFLGSVEEKQEAGKGGPEVEPWTLALPPGAYTVSGRVSGARGTATATVASGETHEVTLLLESEGASPDGSVSGTVVDEGGRPVSGCVVMAGAPSSARAPEGMGARMQIEEVGDRSWTLTEEDGRFHLSGLNAGESCTVAAEGGLSTVNTMIPAEGVLLQVVTKAGIRGLVGGPRGPRDVLEVLLEWFPRTGSSQRLRTFHMRESPLFQVSGLAPGTLRAWFRRGSFVGGPVPVELGPGEVKDLGSVTLVPGRPLSGRVVDGSGCPVPGASLTLASGDRADADAVTGADGSFDLGVRPPVPWPISVSGDACVSTVLTLDPAAPAPLVLTVPRGALLRGRVRDGAGLPAAGAVVEATPAGGGEPGRLPVDHLGRFEARMAAGVYQLMIHLDGTATPAGSVRLEDGGASDVALTAR